MTGFRGFREFRFLGRPDFRSGMWCLGLDVSVSRRTNIQSHLRLFVSSVEMFRAVGAESHVIRVWYCYHFSRSLQAPAFCGAYRPTANMSVPAFGEILPLSRH